MARRHRYIRPEVRVRRENKKHLNRALAALRRKGLLVKQRFMCCSSCACPALDTMMKQLEADGKPVKGAVFYHQQDAEYFDGDRRDLMIRFVCSGEDDEAKVVEIGREIVKTLKAAGITTEWDGSASACVEVKLDQVAA